VDDFSSRNVISDEQLKRTGVPDVPTPGPVKPVIFLYGHSPIPNFLEALVLITVGQLRETVLDHGEYGRKYNSLRLSKSPVYTNQGYGIKIF
jgi:hypothetical protein